ncbi:MAG: hypothetical protein O9282_09315 [Flavobacterium sp.]|uniref:hypothetical protein n=1 Tax=Flavobacterium sp. TaxID=239 RepID=UPI0022BEC7D2|nr:hypothetical protein [Flavobacterium sp.]MCZ8331496.1 hypothetical protein [Flavobacterium sp.]
MNLEGVAVLSKEQQKGVNGGAGTCAYILGRNGDGEPIGATNVSLAEARAATAGGGRYCCDSCSTASWISFNTYGPGQMALN